MDFSIEELKRIEELAMDLMSPSEIGVLLGYDQKGFEDEVRSNGTQAYEIYRRGAVTTLHQVRRTLLDAAAAGSPFAIQKVCDFALTIQGMIET